MHKTFDSETLDLLREIEEIDIEAPGARRTIWIVVVGDTVYVRSVNGVKGQWYQAVLAHPDIIIHAGEQPIPARASLETDADAIAQVTTAYLTKYAASEWAPPMAEPHTLPTTLRLEPR